MMAALSHSSRVTRALVLPALFVGDKPTVAGLREGAARLQARVLLVYRPNCRFYERVPFMARPNTELFARLRRRCSTHVLALFHGRLW
jgi:hypothetical protein